MPSRVMILATKPGSPVLKYIGGIRFSEKGRAVTFQLRSDAEQVARDLKKHFPVLSQYRVTISR